MVAFVAMTKISLFLSCKAFIVASTPASITPYTGKCAFALKASKA
nr:hypothetical protein [Campylobacter jejuni]